ncbi:MAG: DUF433 domain-containing protein [Hyphomicrobium sp.]
MKHQRISIDPQVMLGKPCIKGTRITVEHILRLLAGGMSVAEIVRGHPRLTPDDATAAQAYAADVLALPSIRQELSRLDEAVG